MESTIARRAMVVGTLASAFAAATAVPANAISSKEPPLVADPDCIACVSTTRVRKVGNRVRVNGRRVRALTGYSRGSSQSWSTTVTVTASVTASIGVSAKSLTGTFGGTYSISRAFAHTVVVTTDQKRDARLALHADFYRQRIKKEYLRAGVVTKTVYTYLYTPIAYTAGIRAEYR